MESCIGVFDSGLGGLSILRHLIHHMPKENMVYFGDTARVPYGTRSNETIVRYVESDIRFLKTFPVKAIVIACGTASSVALPRIKDKKVPIYGVVDTTAKAAVVATKNGKIGILGTQGTINSGAYERVIHEQNPKISCTSVACPLFVPLVENGVLDDEMTYLAAKRYLEPVKKQGVDTLILGCTHYPLIKKVIADIMGDNVTLIDPGEQTAIFVKTILEEKKLLTPTSNERQCEYYVSDSVQDFSKIGSVFLGKDITEQVKKIDIEKY